MNIRRVVPDITTDRLDESREFYTEFLGLKVAMDMDWIITLMSPSNETAQINLLRGERSGNAHHDMGISFEVADVDAMHAMAVSRGLNIVYPLTDEPWGVRRFFVSDPNGVIVNIMNHIK